MSVTSVAILSCMRPGGQHHGGEIERHSIGLLHEAELADAAGAGLASGDRDRAAGQEFRALARDRGDGRLGERMRDALPLERLQRGGEALVALEPVQRRLRVAIAPLIAKGFSSVMLPFGTRAVQVHAKLLDDLAPDLGDRDPEAHLVEARE